MRSTIIRPESRDAWLALRAEGIGSSEIGTIAGLNPYETPYQLWRRRVGIDPAPAQTPAMRLGQLLEGTVAQLFEDATGLQVLKESEGDWIARADEKPWVQASPDRTYLLPEARGGQPARGVLECKTTQMAVDPDRLPEHWFCQLQYQLGVMGYDRGAVAWLSQGRDFGYADIAFAPDFFEWLVGLADEFMNVNIKGNTPPSPLRAEDVALRFPRETPGATAEATPEVFAAFEELSALRATLKATEERKAALEDTIKLAMGPAEAIAHNGRTLATWKAPKPSARFDTKAFRKDHPDLYERYAPLAPATRRFLLK